MKPDLLLSRFDLLSEGPGNIQRLRKLVVLLAINGLLTNDRGEISTDDLLDRIAVKRQGLTKDGKAMKLKELPPIDEGDYRLDTV